jgi:protein arginine kinase activator
MNQKCEICGKLATVHLTEIKSGKKIEKHLCEQCAAKNEGLPIKSHTPINELLTNFVMAHQGVQNELSASCEHCAITWAEFRQTGMLGCAHDYEQFEKDLTPLLQKAHEGATHHTGKVPTRAGASGVPRKRKMMDVSKLKRELAGAVESEDYERAAKLRDAIREAENG